MVDGVAYEDAEARGLPGGAHQVHVVEGNSRLVFRRRVLLRDDERVELDIDPKKASNPERYRGPIPERPDDEDDPANEPQLLVVGAVEWQNVRLHVDGTKLPLDPDTRTFRRVLDPGSHRVERLVTGRSRPPVVLEVRGHPWQCAIGRDGAMDCVELVEPPDGIVDTAAIDRELERMPVQQRLPYLLALDARLTCVDVARWMDQLFGDASKLTLALGMRAKVTDPWNHAALERALSFPESRRRVEALYAGQVRPPVIEREVAPAGE